MKVKEAYRQGDLVELGRDLVHSAHSHARNYARTMFLMGGGSVVQESFDASQLI